MPYVGTTRDRSDLKELVLDRQTYFEENRSNVGMHEIIRPHCRKAFKIDEAEYADILKQVRDSDFEDQLHERLELAEHRSRGGKS